MRFAWLDAILCTGIYGVGTLGMSVGCQGQAIMFQQRQIRRMQQDINGQRSRGDARGQIGRGGQGRGRYIAAVSAETDVSAMTNPTVNEGIGNTQGRAGAAFGRGRGRGRQGG